MLEKIVVLFFCLFVFYKILKLQILGSWTCFSWGLLVDFHHYLSILFPGCCAQKNSIFMTRTNVAETHLAKPVFLTIFLLLCLTVLFSVLSTCLLYCLWHRRSSKPGGFMVSRHGCRSPNIWDLSVLSTFQNGCFAAQVVSRGWPAGLLWCAVGKRVGQSVSPTACLRLYSHPFWPHGVSTPADTHARPWPQTRCEFHKHLSHSVVMFLAPSIFFSLLYCFNF